MEETLKALSRFEAEANIITFIETFGQDRGKELWNTYKGKCDMSPTRFYRSLPFNDRQILLGCLGTLIS